MMLAQERLRARFAALAQVVEAFPGSSITATLLCDLCHMTAQIPILELVPPPGWYIGVWGHDLCPDHPHPEA